MSSGSSNDIVSSFPSFKVMEPSNSSIDLGFLHFSGTELATASQFGRWEAKSATIAQLKGGFDNTGPLCIFKSDLSESIVIAPLTYHMSSSQNVTFYKNELEFRFGIIGNVSSVPDQFSISWIMSLSNGGINNAMYSWGSKELLYFNKQRGNAHARDFTLNYLGYSTDNGAYYYYNTEPNKTYEQTIIDIKKYVDEENIPVRWILIDSWFYYYGYNEGVKYWHARSDIFPNGMEYIHNATNWHIQAHNRYWSLDNFYANNNPPPFDNSTNKTSELFPFVWSSDLGLPLTRDFWDYLFRINDNWGLTVYEQDHLSNTGHDLEILHGNVTFGRRWLLDMGQAAEEADLCIQYCMVYPRFFMTSVELTSVTQARASHDYTPGNTQWQIGISSIFAHSIDVMPSKDSYWSMNNPQGGHYPNGTHEPYNRMQSCVLSLSNGPVTFSDRIGYSNATLIKRACNEDGLLLRPDSPATAIDRYILYLAYIENNATFAKQFGIGGQVWSTTSKIGLHDRYLYLFVAELEKDSNIMMSDFMYHFDNNDEEMANNYLVFETNHTSKYFEFNSSTPLFVSSCGQYDFQFYTFIPIDSNDDNNDNGGWCLQGEIDKWIGVSPQRFQSIDTSDSGSIEVTIYGAVDETVNVAFVNTKTMQQKIISCKIGQTQTMTIKMPDSTCVPYD